MYLKRLGNAVTPDGPKEIQDIQPGDYVPADDPSTPGEIKAEQVLGTFVKEADSVIDLRIGNSVITTTEDHPFWVPGQGWVEAQDLHVGSVLQKLTGSTVVVEAIESRVEEVRIYNLDVAGFDTFFVSDLELLVHNECNFQKLRKSLASQEQLGQPGVPTAGVPGRPPLRVAQELADLYGGNPNEWVQKVSNTAFESLDIDNPHVETHWFENIVTGQRVNQKTVINPQPQG